MYHLRNEQEKLQSYVPYEKYADAAAAAAKRNKLCVDGEWQVFVSTKEAPGFSVATDPATVKEG